VKVRITRALAVVTFGLAAVSEVTLVRVGLSGGLRGTLRLELWCLVPMAIGMGALAITKLDRRLGVALVIGVGIALQVAALSASPSTSDDFGRYIWDAKVQLHGIDPYRYAPSDAAVASLRTEPLFYPGTACVWKLPGDMCSTINRPTVHTIYPPVAEGAFVLAHLGAGGQDDGPRPVQILAALTAIGVALLLARHALANQRPAWVLMVWAWCPVTIFELGNNAHIDGLAVLFSIGALMSSRAGRPGWAGGLLGAAIATKLYPAVLTPVMFGRGRWRMLTAAVSVVLLSYLPHVIAVGPKVLGYLPGYLKQEDYTNGGRFLLLDVIAPKNILTVGAVLILAIAAAFATRRADTFKPEQQAVWLVGVTLLVSTPSYSWYTLLLLALVVMSGRWEWFVLCFSPTVGLLEANHVHDPTLVRTASYAVGLLAALLGYLIRTRGGARNVSANSSARSLEDVSTHVIT
jgi:alpha-1,2-mannosyltransferase